MPVWLVASIVTSIVTTLYSARYKIIFYFLLIEDFIEYLSIILCQRKVKKRL